MLDDDARRFLPRERRIDVAAERVEGLEIVDEKPHFPAVLGRELAREPPADTDVAEVVDDLAENVAGDFRGRAGRGHGRVSRGETAA